MKFSAHKKCFTFAILSERPCRHHIVAYITQTLYQGFPFRVICSLSLKVILASFICNADQFSIFFGLSWVGKVHLQQVP